jgi:class 3 adenylate cyclase
MESHSLPGRIQVTAATFARLRDRYRFEERGEIEIKGKGRLPVYLLVGRLAAPSRQALVSTPPGDGALPPV